MNARTDEALLQAAELHLSNAHLDALEEETIFILREVAAAFERPTLLFSGGKDSLVMLRCAEKAFGAGRIPFPLLMIDTGHNFPEVTDFRDQRAKELGAELIVRHRGRLHGPRHGASGPPGREPQCAPVGDAAGSHRRVPLRRLASAAPGATKKRPAPRSASFPTATASASGSPRPSAPSCGPCSTPACSPASTSACSRISNWTELDVWQYIAREKIALPCIYYTHQREVVDRRRPAGAGDRLTPAQDGETVELRDVRFRTVGDITCTCPVASLAATPADIVIETLAADVSERGATRMDDKTSDASMEKRKDGYF